MAEFSNLYCFRTVNKEEEIIKSIINDEFKFADEIDAFIATIPILPLMMLGQMPYLPPLQIPLEGTMSSCVKGLSKDQDIVVTGKKGEEYFWIVCCDGHGNNTFVDILKTLDWRTIMEQPNSYYKMQLELSTRSYSILSGSTLEMVKIFKNKIECVSIGDSRVLVYKNGALEYTNTPHDYSVECERQRLAFSATTTCTVRYETFPGISTETTMEPKQLSYVTYTDKTNPSNKVTLAMTQSIGHYNITGLKPEFKTIPYSDSDAIRVIVGTDGFFDMCLVTESTGPSFKDTHDLLWMNAKELANKAEERWKQPWKYYYGGSKFPNHFQETRFEKNSIDDIGIAVWSNHFRYQDYEDDEDDEEYEEEQDKNSA